MEDWVIGRLAAIERRLTELEKQARPVVPAGRSRQVEGWQPGEQLLAWAEEKFPDVNEPAEREKFVDYWTSRGEVRKDWDAAYRNWIRKAHEFGPPRVARPGNGPPSRTTTVDQANRDRRDRVAASLAKTRRD